MSSLEEIYGINNDIKSFAVANQFVENTNKACYKLGKFLKPFCIYGDDKQREHKVIDFAQFDGFVDGNTSLISEVSDYRKDIYKNFGIILDLNDPLKKKLLFYDYLMSISVCYVEIPKYITKNSMHLPSYDKFLCTRNPAIMAAWMGTETNEMQVKYSKRITVSQIDFNLNEMRFVKLNHTSKGNSITVPRNASNVEQMKCVPLFMLYAFTEGFKTVLQDNIIEFTYLKDGGQERVLNSTLNEAIIMDYYNDNNYLNSVLQGVDINSVDQGGMKLSQHVNRGYIKVPELGASKYDSGVRSLNIARILDMKMVKEVDRSFINVDLNGVITNFEEALNYVAIKNASVLPDIFTALVKEDPPSQDTAVLVNAIMRYVNDNHMFLSTTFDRSLHKFMISNPIWFPLYTGVRSEDGISLRPVENYGITEGDDIAF